MPSPGELYTAPWGRYRVHRIDGDTIILQDRDRVGAFCPVDLETLRNDYTLGAQREQPPVVASTEAAPPVREGTSEGTARLGRSSAGADAGEALRGVDTDHAQPGADRGSAAVADAPRDLDLVVPDDIDRHVLTLGAVRPVEPTEKSRGMTHGSYISLPDVELLYWMPCAHRSLVEGASGEPHAYFINSNQSPRFVCEAHDSRGRVEASSPEAVGVSSVPTDVSRPTSTPQGLPAPTPAVVMRDDPKAEVADFTVPAGAPWGNGQPIWDQAPGGRTKGMGRALYEEWSERAAIREYLGLQPRGYAEHAAYREITQGAA